MKKNEKTERTSFFQLGKAIFIIALVCLFVIEFCVVFYYVQKYGVSHALSIIEPSDEGYFLYLLANVIISAAIAFIGVGISKKVKTVRATRQAKMAEEERKTTNALEGAAISSICKKIEEGKDCLWIDIVKVIVYYKYDMSCILHILSQILSTPLSQVVIISTTKKQIFWTDGTFLPALQILEKVAQATHHDEKLELLIQQVGDFVKLLNQYKDFKGYEQAIDEVQNRCSTVYGWLPLEVKTS